MSKKYVYFKYRADIQTNFPKDSLAELELEGFDCEFRPVNTIFQLMDIPDLKLIISKSEPIQKLLSSALPANGMHGFIWSGNYIPAYLNRILFSSVMIDRCFIFQRNTDPEPEISNSAYARPKHRTDVYNWWVYSFYSFHYIFQKAQAIRRVCESEIEIDNQLNNLLDSDTAAEFISVKNDNKSVLFRDQQETLDYQHVLLNYLTNPVCLINPVSAPDTFSALTGKELHIVYDSETIGYKTRFLSRIFQLDLQEYHDSIDSILSSIRLLLTSSEDQQADLFMDPLGKDFISVWQLEKERLESVQLSLSSQNRMAFAVTRFLIDRNIISNSQTVTDLLEIALRHTMALLLKKQGNLEFVPLYQKTLRGLYSDLYLLEKLRPFSALQTSEWKFYFGLNDTGLNNAESIIFRPLQAFPEKMNKTEMQLARLWKSEQVNRFHPDFDEELIWHDEIALQGRMLRKSGRSGKYLFNRLYSQNLKKEALTLFWHWMQIDQFLEQAIQFTTPGAKICLILPNIKIENRSVSIKSIILEKIQEEDLIQFFKMEKVLDSLQEAPTSGPDLIILRREKEFINV